MNKKQNNLKFNLFKIGIKQSFWIIFFDFISILASIITIYSSYYQSRSFNLNCIWDFIINVVALLALMLFVYRCYQIIGKWEKLVLPKALFFKYIEYQILKADNEIKNIAGDLSWLERLKDKYFTIKKENNISIVIYYSSDKISNNSKLQCLIKEYQDNGIQMISYPPEIRPNRIKGMLIDISNNERFLSFTKEKDGDFICCNKYYCHTNEYYMALAFLNTIEAYISLKEKYEKQSTNTKQKIFIGISGINNIGKTTLCNELKQTYGNKVAIIGDPFISDLNKSSFEIAIFCLLNQLIEYHRIINEYKDKSIFIFDRTPIDNFAFLIHHKNTNEYDRYIEHLKHEIKKFMLYFDVLVLMYPDEKYIWKKTSVLSPDERKKINETIQDLYSELYSDKLIKYGLKTYSQKKFRQHIKTIISDLSTKIPRV